MLLPLLMLLTMPSIQRLLMLPLLRKSRRSVLEKLPVRSILQRKEALERQRAI